MRSLVVLSLAALMVLGACAEVCEPSIGATPAGDAALDLVLSLDCDRNVSVHALHGLLKSDFPDLTSALAVQAGNVAQVTAALAAETSTQTRTAATVASLQSAMLAVNVVLPSLAFKSDVSALSTSQAAALATVAASVTVAVSTNREDLNATKTNLAALGVQVNVLATQSSVSALRSTVLAQAALIEGQRLQIVELRCKASLGVDVCGVCNGDNSTCCPGQHFYGTGKDGTFTTPADVVLQDWVPSGRVAGLGVAYRVVPPAIGATSLACFGGCTFVGLAAGDQVLLLSVQGVQNDSKDVGNRAFHTVVSATATLVVAEAVALSFVGQTPANQIVVVQRVPQFESLSVAGSLRAAPWDGGVSRADGTVATGVVVLRVKTLLTGGSVSANMAGFRGGCGSASGYCYPACNGEGIDQPARALAGAASTGGGAGGHLRGSWCTSEAPIDHAPVGGGGGSYATNVSSIRGISGTVYGNATLKKLFLGGGGGGATSYRHVSGSGYGSAGANGGGILMLFAKSIQGAAFSAVGGVSGPKYIHGGTGGGGAGGSVLVQCDSCVYSIAVDGGTANNDFYSNGRGTDGGWGRFVVHRGVDLQLCRNDNGVAACQIFASLPAYCAAISS